MSSTRENRERAMRRLKAFAPPAGPEGSFRAALAGDFGRRLRSDSTRNNYESAILCLTRFLGHEPMIDELTPEGLDAFRVWADGYLGKYTVNGYFSSLRAILRHAAPDRFPRYPTLSRRPKGREPSPGSLLEFFESTYAPIRLPAASPHTLKNFRIAIGRLERHLGRPPELSDLTDDTIAGLAFAMGQSDVPGIMVGSVVTLNTNLKKLRAVWNFAARRGVVPDWPEVGDVREPKRIPRCWSLEQFATLLKACQAAKGEICGVPASGWWHALHLFIYATGARYTAAMALRWRDVNLETGVVTLLAENQKQFADQQFRLPPFALEALAAIRQPEREAVWPWPSGGGRGVYYHYAELLRRAGLPNDDRKLKFHALRKLSASLLKAAGGDPTQHLGHSSPRVTAVYLVPEIVGVVSQCHLLPDPIKPCGKEGGA